LGEGWDESVFEDGEVEGGIWGCRGGAHGGTTELEPVSVTKHEQVVLHDEPEGRHEFSDRNVSKVVPAEVDADASKGFASRDVGIHRYGIGSEQFCMGGQGSEFKKQLFESVRVLEVGALLLGNDLELVVDPNTKAVEQAARARDDGAALEWGFVDFHSEIEGGVGVLSLFKVMNKELLLVLGEDATSGGVGNPGGEISFDTGHAIFGLSWCQEPIVIFIV
jgi:hypothetical protein